MQRGDAAKAIQELETAAPYETVVPRLLVGATYPICVRGEAFLAERHGTEAAAEFQKILDHRGVVVSDPVGALARLQLASAYRMVGDRANATAAYDDFFLRWKNADADVPVLIQARRESTTIRN